jgi:hypothetical protein
MDECRRLADELARVVGSIGPGPVRERLDSFVQSAETSLYEVTNVVRRGGDIERLTATVDVAGITAAYKRAQREVETAAERGAVPERLTDELESLRGQHRSAQRLLNALDDIDGRVAAVQNDLRDLVLAAGEVSLTGSDTSMATIEARVDNLASDARALQAALAELA